MNLNLRNMIAGDPASLRHVFRYSTRRVHCPESVAEHSYYVAFYSMLIARWCKEDFNLDTNVGGIDTEKLLQRALLHDLEEARIGDLPRPFKHSTPALTKVLEEAGETAYQQVIDSLIPDGTDNPIAIDYYESWAKAKDCSFEGHILRFADFLSVLGFLVQEGAGGNPMLLQIGDGMVEYFNDFLDKKFDFTRPLVDQAGVIMKEVFGG